MHTLPAYFQEVGARVRTVRPENCEQTLSDFLPDLVVLFPGLGRPADFNLEATIKLYLVAKIPLFWVCLGLQGIVEYFGGSLSILIYPIHSKGSTIDKAEGLLFDNISLPLTIGRYHALVASTVPDYLKVTARSKTRL